MMERCDPPYGIRNVTNNVMMGPRNVKNYPGTSYLENTACRCVTVRSTHWTERQNA